MRSYGAFPVHPGRADRETLRLMEDYIAKGFVLGIFPEGTRSTNAVLIPALNGAAMVAHHTNVPVLPIGIAGTEHMRSKWWFLKRPVIHIHIGPLLRLPTGNGKIDRTAATRMIMGSIAALLPPEYRGVYAETG
jgi:1-acyl-sn-glycerol-3-phosphate acyltransferase